MVLLGRRLLFLFLFPLGILCLWSPFDLHRTETVTADVVDIQWVGYAKAVHDDVGSPPLDGIPNLPNAAPITCGAITEGMASLLQQASTPVTTSEFLLPSLREEMSRTRISIRLQTTVQVHAGALREFSDKFGEGSPSELQLTYRDHLFLVENRGADLQKALESSETELPPLPVAIRLLGPIVPATGAIEVAKSALSRHPSIEKLLEPPSEKKTDLFSPDEEERVLEEEWSDFIGALGQETKEEALLSSDGNLFQCRIETSFDDIEEPIPGLSVGMRIVGFSALCLALFAAVGLYRSPPSRGISLSSPALSLLLDAISMAFIGLAMFTAVDCVLVALFEVPSLVRDGEITFMGIFFLVLATPALSLYASSFSAQRVLIEREGVTVHSLFSTSRAAWEEIECVETSDSYVPVGRGGAVMTRKLMTSLFLRTAHKGIRILEPGTSRTKQAIVDSLLANAPEKLKPEILVVDKDWQ